MIEGQVLDRREDDFWYVPDEFDTLTAEQSWSDPQALGHVPSSFAAHIEIMTQRSIEKGLVEEIPEELISIRDEVASVMLSYNEFMDVLACVCDNETEFMKSIQGDDHEGHDHEQNRVGSDEDDDKKKKKKAKGAKGSGANASWTRFLMGLSGVK